MNQSFDLKISLKKDGSCIFHLTWEQGNKDIYVNQTFMPQLRRDYKVWQRAYLRYYNLPNDEKISRNGGISISMGDPSLIVRGEEEAFLSTFLDWLGSGDNRLIERQIQATLLEIKQSVNQDFVQTSSINIYLTCDERFLRPLPWEFWVKSLIPQGFPEDSIRLIRTIKDDPSGLAEAQSTNLARKPRILAILGVDPNLSINEDWQIIKSLRPIAYIEQAIFPPDAEPQNIIKQVLTQITDDRGWDILFFAGHSDDRENSSGSFQLTNTVSLSTSDIADHLEIARSYGLQLAIFNSCCGLAIAQSLTRMGIQSVVMREKIHSDVAIVFLEQLCRQLKQYKDIHTSLLEACKFLRKNENIKFPSAHLIPSFFSPPRKLPYYFKRRSWQDKLKLLMPKKREIIFSSCALLISSLAIIPTITIEARVALQSVYRDLTDQYPKSNETPIHVIAVDQKYLDERDINMNAQKNIPHNLIADIINQVSDSAHPEILGISYILNDKNQQSESLLSAIQDTNKTHNSWFTLASSEEESLAPNDDLKALPMTFQGDSYFYFWDVDTPDDKDLEDLCPFAYNLVLLYNLKQDNIFSEPSELQAKIKKTNKELTEENSEFEFCNSFLEDLKTHISKESETHDFIVRNQSKFGWLSIIDFSIPPKIVYERTVVSDLESFSSRDNSETIFIIGSGSYRDAEDNYSPPLALEYWWCLSPRSQFTEYNDRNDNCPSRPRSLSFAETSAYMTSQLLQDKQLRVVPNYLMIFLAILLSKAFVLILESYPLSQRKKILQFTFFSTLGYIVLSFQLYISVSILFPILFPVSLCFYYLKPIFMRTYP